MLKITGTFIDEISHDIPSANWGPDEWQRDFDAMKIAGIDTVILIRAGYRNKTTFKSKTIDKYIGDVLPVPFDLVELFLDQAQRCGMNFFFGTYDSGSYWLEGNYTKEVEINKIFCEEVIAKYGHKKAFKGWYVSHEIDTYNEAVMNVYRQLATHLKSLKNLPILISPFIHGVKQFADNPVTVEQHVKSWDKVFSEIKGLIDIVAFQDGQVSFSELAEYIVEHRKLAQKHGVACWSNVETFSRDMPIKFPPIGWPELLHKMTIASERGVEKLITFEFSHFMSPNSIYPAAHNLFQRYLDWHKQSQTTTKKITGIAARYPNAAIKPATQV
jgi:hypothetical protein